MTFSLAGGRNTILFLKNFIIHRESRKGIIINIGIILYYALYIIISIYGYKIPIIIIFNYQ